MSEACIKSLCIIITTVLLNYSKVKKVFFLIFNKCDPSIMKQRVSLKDVQVVSENTGETLGIFT